MKSIKVGSLFLFIAVILLAVFVGGKQINSTIEDTIKSNYQAEIEVLKDKINKQSELINSIINISNKNELSTTPNPITTTKLTNVTTEAPKQDEAELIDFEYIKENGGVTITRYTGKNTTVQIPNKIEQLPVLKIGENAFSDTKVKSVTLPSSCVEIDWFAFYGCYALTTVYISSNVNAIGYGAFDACSKSLTVYCEQNSYAQKYAQSFGISYLYFQ